MPYDSSETSPCQQPRWEMAVSAGLRSARSEAKWANMFVILVTMLLPAPVALIGGVPVKFLVYYLGISLAISFGMIAFAATVSGVVEGLAALHSSGRDEKNPAATPATQSDAGSVPVSPVALRPFAARLSRFVGQTSTTNDLNTSERHSRMPFFMSVDDVKRRDPKPAEFFRRILWHIRQLVHGPG